MKRNIILQMHNLHEIINISDCLDEGKALLTLQWYLS